MLLLGYTFSFVDRQVLNLLVEPIREDLGVSDTQISFLQGIAFVGTYVLMSVPIGRMVDRFHRVVILIGGVLAWSASTVGCGLSRTYAQLLFARMGVGAGEATLTPGSWSILADYFPPDRLARPMSVFLIGPYLGAGLALIAGAEVIAWTKTIDELSVPLLGVIAPWQFTCIALGLPGAVIAALLATIREPKRIGSSGTRPEAVSWPEAWSLMIERRRVYAALLLGVPFIVVILYGLQAWVPTFLVRVYEWEIPQAGRVYGLIALIAGSAGVLSGPYAAAWLQARGHRDHPLRLAVISGGLVMVNRLREFLCDPSLGPDDDGTTDRDSDQHAWASRGTLRGHHQRHRACDRTYAGGFVYGPGLSGPTRRRTISHRGIAPGSTRRDDLARNRNEAVRRSRCALRIVLRAPILRDERTH